MKDVQDPSLAKCLKIIKQQSVFPHNISQPMKSAEQYLFICGTLSLLWIGTNSPSPFTDLTEPLVTLFLSLIVEFSLVYIPEEFLWFCIVTSLESHLGGWFSLRFHCNFFAEFICTVFCSI